MNRFLLDDEPLPVPPVSSYQRAIAAYDLAARSADPGPCSATFRSREDVLVEAKAVDERVRTGEDLPLAGLLVAVQDNATAVRRLGKAGAVIFATAGESLPDGAGTQDRPAILDLVDAVTSGRLPTGYRDVAGLSPTRGLVPGLGPVAVLARDVGIAQRALAALTGPDDTDPSCRSWPAAVRFSAGEHPRVAVPRAAELGALSPESRAALAATADSLRAAGGVVTEIELARGLPAWAARPATLLRGHDALLMPAEAAEPALARILATFDTAAALLPGGPAGLAVVTRAFDDQIGIDLVAMLTGVQAEGAYPASGVDLVAFGGFLRGQPRNAELAALGARFTGFAETAPRYRMVVLPGSPPEAGVVSVAGEGASLLAERWLLSPAGLGRFLAGLRAPLMLGGVELAEGETVTGLLCDPVAAEEGEDISGYGCWRAYLRYLSTRRPSALPAPC
ncbi:amidase family protein [Saccharomonospora sp. NPDC006951]